MEVERIASGPAKVTYGSENSEIIRMIATILSENVRKYTYYVNHDRISVFDPEEEGTKYDIQLTRLGVVLLTWYRPAKWEPGTTDMISCGSFHIASADPATNPEEELVRLVEALGRKVLPTSRLWP